MGSDFPRPGQTMDRTDSGRMWPALFVTVFLVAGAGCSGDGGRGGGEDAAVVGPDAARDDAAWGVDGSGQIDGGTMDAGVDAAVDAAFPAPEPDDCITDVTAGEHEFPCEGYDYDVSIPAECLTRACGLIMDVHGLSMSGDIMDENDGMRELGRQHGYIVVQPNSNPGPPLGGWYPNDYDAVWAFMERTAAVFHVDSGRWHFTGFSQGGRMTWTMLCDHSDKLASVAPAAYGMEPSDPCSELGGQLPQQEIPVLYVHGTEDTVRQFGEAETQRDNLIADWSMSEDTVVSQDANHVWTRYTNSNGTIFEFFQHDYQAESNMYNGHCIPGGLLSGGLTGFACVESGTPNWPQMVIQFFMDHPRP